jgi:cystathionine gamma-synthase/cystathionine gamma-lyase/cystathionine beta-lyase
VTRTVHGLDTRLVHAGEPEPRILGAVVAPIFQSVTFEQGDAQGEVRYLRLGNTPGQLSLQRKLAALESPEGGWGFSTACERIRESGESEDRPRGGCRGAR